MLEKGLLPQWTNTALQEMERILAANDDTARFGLQIRADEARALAAAREATLISTGRIEFGPGITDKLMRAFCNSPYVSNDNFAEVLHRLTEMFYYFKNETLDAMGDDDLISFMQERFDGVCKGSLSLLEGRELEALAHAIRFGEATDIDGEIEQDMDEEDVEDA